MRMLGETTDDYKAGTIPEPGQMAGFDTMMSLLGGYMDPLYDGDMQFGQYGHGMIGAPGVGVAEAFYSSNPHWGGMNDQEREQFAERAHGFFGGYY